MLCVCISFHVCVLEYQISILIEIGMKDEIQLFLCETVKYVMKMKYNTIILIKHGKIIVNICGL